MTDQERAEYEGQVLQIIERFSPRCSDYQLWRGLAGTPLDLKYPKALYSVLADLISAGAIEAHTDPDYPHSVYAVKDLSKQSAAQS